MEFNSEEDNSLDRLLCSSQENTINNSKIEIVEDIDYEDEYVYEDVQNPKNPENPENSKIPANPEYLMEVIEHGKY